MDERWKKRVFPILPALLEILLPLSLIDGLIAVSLITLEEYEELSLPIHNDVKRSRMLLLSILPKKGPDSFDGFMNVLNETEGQKHVAQRIMKIKRNKSSEPLVDWEEKVKDLERELKKEREEKNQEKVTNICLRTKIGPSMGSPSLKWKKNMPNMPIGCWPYGRVAEINGMLHVGDGNRMFQFKKGAWEGEEHHLPGIRYIWSVFECEGKGYVMDRCSSIYEWKSETRELKLLTKIPDEYQPEGRSAIGHNGNIYLVGGTWSDRVDCFDINKGKWEPIKKMKNERDECSLAVINDKMFVGGGYGYGAENSVECFSMEKQGWIDIEPTTKELCQLSSWNGKLVATGGGYYRSNHVEMYDELSGVCLPLPSMNKGRVFHGACTTKDNQLIVVGGWGARNSVECLKM